MLLSQSRRVSLVCVLFSGLSLAVWPTRSMAQTTATITGTVADASGAVVPGADISLIKEDTGDKHLLKSQGDGTFVIPDLFPGTYTIQIKAPGFKTFDKQNINIEASQRATLGQLVLQVGAASETITVQAQGELVQANSEERSAVLDQTQLDTLGEAGRFALGLLKTMPGIPDPGDGGGLPSVNGISAQYNGMATDGIPNTELGTTGFSSTRPTLDSVQEIKVISGNYQAEYGTFGGGQIQLVTRGGTSQYHGTMYIYKEHEMFNANSFFNNRNGVVKPVSRMVKWGGSIGGPVRIPKVPGLKDKLFFFINQEFTIAPFDEGLYQYTVPTALERAGNFSQSLNTSGQLIPVKNPATGIQFPGNIIPPSMINPSGQNLFKIFPMPNFTNTALSLNQYNYEIQETQGRNNREQQTWRGDYNMTPKIRIYLRGIYELNQEFSWLYTFTTPTLNGLNHITENDISMNTTEILSPSLVNEFVFGFHHPTEFTMVAGADESQDRIRLHRPRQFRQVQSWCRHRDALHGQQSIQRDSANEFFRHFEGDELSLFRGRILPAHDHGNEARRHRQHDEDLRPPHIQGRSLHHARYAFHHRQRERREFCLRQKYQQSAGLWRRLCQRHPG